MAAFVSAVPELQGHRVAVGLGFIALVTVLNPRGIREPGSIFAVPTYLFLAGILGMIGLGIARNALDGFATSPPAIPAGRAIEVTGSLGILLILTAFSRGRAALTGGGGDLGRGPGFPSRPNGATRGRR